MKRYLVGGSRGGCRVVYEITIILSKDGRRGTVLAGAVRRDGKHIQTPHSAHGRPGIDGTRANRKVAIPYVIPWATLY